MKPGGISSTWWETSTVAGDISSIASTDSVDTRSSRPPRSSPAAGSSSSSSSGSVISARAICTRLRSPSLRVPKVRSARWPAPTSREQLRGPVVVELVVVLAPPAEHAVRRGHDDVADPLVARDPLGQRGAGQADPGPQLEDVDRAEHLAEDPDDAGGRVDLRRARPASAWSCRRRWARARPSARPPRPPSRRRRAGWPRRADGHVGQLENGVHDGPRGSLGVGGSHVQPTRPRRGGRAQRRAYAARACARSQRRPPSSPPGSTRSARATCGPRRRWPTRSAGDDPRHLVVASATAPLLLSCSSCRRGWTGTGALALPRPATRSGSPVPPAFNPEALERRGGRPRGRRLGPGAALRRAPVVWQRLSRPTSRRRVRRPRRPTRAARDARRGRRRAGRRSTSPAGGPRSPTS